MYKYREKRKYKRIEKPYMVRFRTIPLVAKNMGSTDCDTKHRNILKFITTYYFPNTIYCKRGFRQIYF